MEKQLKQSTRNHREKETSRAKWIARQDTRELKCNRDKRIENSTEWNIHFMCHHGPVEAIFGLTWLSTSSVQLTSQTELTDGHRMKTSTIVMWRLTGIIHIDVQNLNRIFSLECLKLAIKWHYIHELFLFRMCLFFSFFICCWHCFLFWDESATRTKESNIKIISSTCIHCLC